MYGVCWTDGQVNDYRDDGIEISISENQKAGKVENKRIARRRGVGLALSLSFLWLSSAQHTPRRWRRI